MTVYKNLGIEAGLDFYNKYLIANPEGHLEQLLAAQNEIKLYSCKITDMLFFKDETKRELTYFRKRVDSKEIPEAYNIFKVHQDAKKWEDD